MAYFEELLKEGVKTEESRDFIKEPESQEAITEPIPEVPKKPKITIKKIEVSDTIKDIFNNIHENLDKIWGYDNATGREKGKPKYKNLWRDWTRFKEWFKREVMKK